MDPSTVQLTLRVKLHCAALETGSAVTLSLKPPARQGVSNGNKVQESQWTRLHSRCER